MTVKVGILNRCLLLHVEQYVGFSRPLRDTRVLQRDRRRQYEEKASSLVSYCNRGFNLCQFCTFFSVSPVPNRDYAL